MNFVATKIAPKSWSFFILCKLTKPMDNIVSHFLFFLFARHQKKKSFG